MGGLSRISSAREAEIERDYAELRPAIRAMLRTDFPRLRELDELYQEAWAELLELEGRGQVVHSRRALLKTIAWRRAVDISRRRRPEAIAPTNPALVTATDDALLPEDQVQLRLDADRLRLVIEGLDTRQAAALKLRFDLHLSAREIQSRLGVSPKRLEKIVTEAYKRVVAEISSADGKESAWLRRQRSLLLACEVGIASPRQRERARRLVERDATCRAMLREMRAHLHGIAVLVPVPVLAPVDRHTRPLELLLGRLDDLWLGARQIPYQLHGRGPSSSSALEQLGLGGTAIGAGATAKIVAFCLAAGGTIGLCVEGASLLGPDPKPAVHRSEQPRRIIEPPRTTIAVVRRAPSTTVASKPPRRSSRPPRRMERPVSSTLSRPAASPAPQGGVEFGPGSIGSAAAPRTAASAPSNGGGEFGP